ncbi:MAG: pyridoxamine 5'-phosphate oxidase family protein [Candidatus Dormibacteria bacterium]
MPEPDLSALTELAYLDRFVQWDLITVNPWGTPSVAPVGARLLPSEGTIWTSTTVGYAAKLRNLRLHPRVTLLRAPAGEPARLLLGEAVVVPGDGTANLTQLFRLMGGPGGPREFFGVTAQSPFWRSVYREYWRRALIRIRIVEVGSLGPSGWEMRRLRPWRQPRERRLAAAASGSRSPTAIAGLEIKGRQMLADALPSVLALASEDGGAPLAFPVQARTMAGGGLQVRAPGLPGRRVPKASLAVRVFDDSFEFARMVGWIGTLGDGAGWRDFQPRSVYGLAKPPGFLPDLAAGLAAGLMSARSAGSEGVSRPAVDLAAADAPGSRVPPLALPETVWVALQQLFVQDAALAPWYAGLAFLARSPEDGGWFGYLAQRAELERDWAQSLLVRGGRRVGAVSLGRGLLVAGPRTVRARAEAARRDLALERSRKLLRSALPPSLSSGLAPPLAEGSRGRAPLPGQTSWLGAAFTAAGSAAAALDRILPTRRT